MTRHHLIVPNDREQRLHVVHTDTGLELYQSGHMIIDVPREAIVELMNECSMWLSAHRKESTP